MKYLQEGDANTKFFHARASCRRRKNHISVITVDDTELSSHDAKTQALTDY